MDRLAPLSVTLIPHWTYVALKLNGLTVADTDDYDKLRATLALNDIVDLVVCNRIINVDGIVLGNQNHPFSVEKITQASMSELQNSVLLEAGVESSASFARNKFGTMSPNYDRYGFEKNQNTIYVIVPEGFQKALDSNDFKLKFVRDFLKQCYSMASVEYVNAHIPLFKAYVKLISQKA